LAAITASRAEDRIESRLAGTFAGAATADGVVEGADIDILLKKEHETQH
jgi:hypothetical protein